MHFTALLSASFALLTLVASAPASSISSSSTSTVPTTTTTPSATKSVRPYVTTISFPPTFTPEPQPSTFPPSQGRFQCIQGDYYHRGVDTEDPTTPIDSFINGACNSITGGTSVTLQPGQTVSASGETTEFELVSHARNPLKVTMSKCVKQLEALVSECTVPTPRPFTAGGCGYSSGYLLEACIFPYYGIDFPGKE